MPTEDEFAAITNKKLMGFVDFDTYLMKYLRNGIRETTKRLFVQGSFEERMPLSSSSANEIEVGLKPTFLDGFAHDGAGRLLNLERIDRSAVFENVSGQVYEVGASYIEFPREIRINPRTGKAEYDRLVEGIGVQASPDEVAIGMSTITFRVDGLFEQDNLGDHTGRDVRVFRIAPGDAGNTAAAAIETCVVFFDSGQNKITTTGYLGQTVPNEQAGFYVVQLIGLMVYRNSAANSPAARPGEVFFIGTVEGNGGAVEGSGIPSVFDISGQNVIQAQSAAGVTVDPLGDWFDGTPNPGGTTQSVFEKIVEDLSSADIVGSGAGKVATPALPDWLDGTPNPANSVAGALSKIVSDLSATGSASGAQKVSSLALGEWDDGTLNVSESVQDALAGIVAALTSTTGLRGAGKITGYELDGWADGTVVPATTLALQLLRIVTDLASAGGAAKVGTAAINSAPIAVDAGTLQNALNTILPAVNSEILASRQRAEAVAMQTLRPVHIVPSWTLVSIAHITNGLGTTATLVAVGDAGTIVSRPPGEQWASRTPAGGFSDGWAAVAGGVLGFAIVGDGGWIQTSSDATVWTTRKSSGANLTDIAYKSTSTATYCAVGLSGHIWTSTNLTTWTQRTLPGAVTDNLVAVTAGVVKGASPFSTQIFVALSDSGKVFSSPDGITWTQRAVVTSPSGVFLERMLQNSSRFGFVALFTRIGGTEIGVAHSDDGITWAFSSSSGSVSLDEPNVRMCLLDESIAYLTTQDDSAPYSLNAIQVGGESVRPSVASNGQNIFDIAECFPFGAENVNGTLFVVGRLNNGDGVILSGAPFRPSGEPWSS